MARWRIPVLSLALAACGLSAVGVAVDDVTPGGPDGSIGPEGSRAPDAPPGPTSDGQVITSEAGGSDATASDADAEPGADAGANADADASSDAGADADADADAGGAVAPGTIETLHTSSSVVRSIAVRSDGVFVARSGAAERIPLSPGGGTQTVSAIQNAISLVEHSDDIVWISDTELGRYQVNGSGNTRGSFSGGRDAFVANGKYLAVFGGTVRTWDYPDFGSSASHEPSGSPTPSAITGDGQSVFWSDPKDNSIYRSSYGSNGTVLAAAKDSTSIVVDGPNLFFTTDTAILRCPKAACVVQTVASGQEKPRSLATDDTFVYWLEAATGSLKRTPKVGVALVETLAPNGAFPAGQPYGRLIVVNAAWVYWGNPADRTIKRLKK